MESHWQQPRRFQKRGRNHRVTDLLIKEHGIRSVVLSNAVIVRFLERLCFSSTSDESTQWSPMGNTSSDAFKLARLSALFSP
jgi:hypothetical protein